MLLLLLYWKLLKIKQLVFLEIVTFIETLVPKVVTFRPLELQEGSTSRLHSWPVWLWLFKPLDPSAQEAEGIRDSLLLRCTSNQKRNTKNIFQGRKWKPKSKMKLKVNLQLSGLMRNMDLIIKKSILRRKQKKSKLLDG